MMPRRLAELPDVCLEVFRVALASIQLQPGVKIYQHAEHYGS